MIRIQQCGSLVRRTRAPRAFALIFRTQSTAASAGKGAWLHQTHSIVNKTLSKTILQDKSLGSIQGPSEVRYTASQRLFETVASKISSGDYKDVVPILSEYRRKRLILSNPHLLSLISLLLNVEELNLKGIAYEVFLLYNSEIKTDIKGYPNELLEMLLDVVFYYEDNNNFDILFSQYLNSPVLNERILTNALKSYIDSSNIELSKQLLYQVITYYSQNGIYVSPKVLEVFLQRLLLAKADFNNILFAYNIWAQQGLPMTSLMNDLMLRAMILSPNTNKVNNFIIKLTNEDPQVLKFNEFLLKVRCLPDLEILAGVDSLKSTFGEDRKYFYSRVIREIDNISFMLNYLLPYIIKDIGATGDMLSVIANQIIRISGIQELTKFIDTKVIFNGAFNFKFLKLYYKAYITNFPDDGFRIESTYKKFMRETFDSDAVYWLPKALNVELYKFRDDYKAIKSSRVKVMQMTRQVDQLESSIIDKFRALSNSLSRSGLQLAPFLHKYLIAKYESPLFMEPWEIKFVEEKLLETSSEEDVIPTELAILKKNIRILFTNFDSDHASRYKQQKDLVVSFISKHASSLNYKHLSQLCDIFIELKDFDASTKILGQVETLREQSREKLTFEERNYDDLLIARLKFKEAVLSLNYPRIISLILEFKKEDKLSMRKFFIRALRRDLKFLEKHRTRLNSIEVKDIDLTKEVMVIDKLCIYMKDFIEELVGTSKKEADLVLQEFHLKLMEYGEHCK